MFKYEEWEAEFAPKLKNTRRWAGFSYIAKQLSSYGHSPKILEVGCMRVDGSWEADGQSTRVWDWMCKGGSALCNSFDLSAEHVALARLHCRNVNAYVGEGIRMISQNPYGVADDLDVLFLDGMDFTGPHAYNAWISHIGMLAAAWPRLKPGCLIVLDDCVDNNEGKHVMIKDFFRRMGNEPLIESYMHIWRMPNV